MSLRTRLAVPHLHLIPIILLSIFDGIGTAAHIANNLGLRLLLYLAWEIDPACITVSKLHHPSVEHRGDFMEDTLGDFKNKISKADPDGKAIIVIVMAPPCPDFSPVKGTEAPGRKGTGQKFDRSLEFRSKIIELIKDSHRHATMVENVILQNQADIPHFEDLIGGQAIVGDAADFKVVSRPRLWWLTINWNTMDKIITDFTDMEPVLWDKHHGLDKIMVTIPNQRHIVPRSRVEQKGTDAMSHDTSSNRRRESRPKED